MDTPEHTTKQCSKCAETLPATPEYFHRNSAARDGLQKYCKACARAYNHIYHQEHTEERQTYARQWREATREKRLAKIREWRANNREHVSEYNARYQVENRERLSLAAAQMYAENREQILAEKAEQRRQHPELFSERARTWRITHREEHHVKYRVNSIRRRARKRNLPVDFTYDDFRFLYQYWHYACAICGREEGFEWVLSLDHWRPVSDPTSPGSVATNILLLCDGVNGCNTRKQNKDGYAFLVERLGPRKARAKLKEIEAYFALVAERRQQAS